jgi:arginase
LTAKLIRHSDQLALVGAPTSAGCAAKGVENGPEALRLAGLVERLREVGYQVTDSGDLPMQLPQSDPENPRARNLKGILALLEPLRLRVEQSSKAHAFPLVLGGDVTIAVALLAALRRQAAALGLIHMGRHADLHTPMHTEDGIVASMTVSHLIGQGAAELVRFWKEPPLVREPDLALYGLAEPDAIDRQRLGSVAVRPFAIQKVRHDGARASAEAALERLRADSRDFVVLLLADVFSPEEVPGGARATAGGLTVAEVGEALNCFAERSTFAGLAICGYDPALDPERRGAQTLVRLVTEAMAARHAALVQPTVEPETETGADEAAGGKNKRQKAAQPPAEVKPEPETGHAEEAEAEAETETLTTETETETETAPPPGEEAGEIPTEDADATATASGSPLLPGTEEPENGDA